MIQVDQKKTEALQIRAVGPDWDSKSETGATNDGNFLTVLKQARMPVEGSAAEKLVKYAIAHRIPPETAFALVEAANNHNVSPRNALELSARMKGGEASVDAVLGLSRRLLAVGGKGATAPALIVSQLSQIASVDAGFERNDPDKIEVLQKASEEKKVELASKLGELQSLSRDYAHYHISLKAIIELWEIRQDMATVEHDLECIIVSGKVHGERGVNRLVYMANLKALINALKEDSSIESEEFFSEERVDPIFDDEIDEAFGDTSWRKDVYLEND